MIDDWNETGIQNVNYIFLFHRFHKLKNFNMVIICLRQYIHQELI